MANLTEEDFIPFQKFVFLILKNWQWFVLSISLSLLVSMLINRYSANIFSNSVKINVNNSSNIIGPLESVLGENSSKINSINFSDKIFMITSYPLVYKTVNDLGFNVEYFIQGNIKTAESYKYRPITFNPIDFNQKYGQEFIVDVLNQYEYTIEFNLKDKKTYLFNEVVNSSYGSFSVSLNDYFDLEKINDYPKLIVKVKNPHTITKFYKNKIKVNRLSKEAAIINISIKGEDLVKETEFLNKLCDNYIQNDLNTKNEVSTNTINFIDKQLLEIKDSLNLIEAQLQIFKKNNGVVQISVESQKFYDDIKVLQNKKSKLLIENKYFDFLSDYLNKKSSFDDIIVPVSYGISNNLLNDLITELVDFQLERELLNPKGTLINPVISELNGKIDRLKSTLFDMILNLKSKNNILIKDFSKRIKVSEDMLKTLPSIERELINIERHYDLSENIYLLLMTKRTEAGILSAGNVSDAKVVEPAIIQSGVLVSPNKTQNNILALLIGIFLPFTVFTLIELFYTKISGPGDIEKNSKIPYLGYVASNNTGFDLIVNEKPKSRISESFRNIRSNIEFILPKHKLGKAVLFTSSISGEGKTFCSINIATVYAISGKKTIVVGADLRRPKMFLTFTKNNDIGLSTYLSGISSKEEIIHNSKIENLDYIKSGPIPPNPAELLGRDKMKDFIKELQNEYDYVIIDSPPIFIVSDSMMLMEIVDLNIYVMRQNYTKRELLNYANSYYDSEKLKNISIILNDVDFSNNYVYNYGYKYDYNYSYNYGGGYYDEE
ncbi:MAG: polysaccharide biosynthesis tyrosine autokinase [Flavobacteriales bacterium]